MVPLFISIDIGTTNTKGSLFDINGNKIAQHSICHLVQSVHPGWAEHNMETDWWLSAVHVIKQLVSLSSVNPQAIKSIMLSGMCPSLGVTDERGTPLRNAITQSDIRQPKRTLEDYGLKPWNHSAKSTYIVPKLLWIKENEPEIFAKIRKIFMSHNYVFFRLTGRYCTDFSTPCWLTPLYDKEKCEFNREAFKALSLDLCQTPEVYSPIEASGNILPEIAALTGLSHDTKVLTGTMDFYLSLMSGGVRNNGDGMLYFGSVGLCVACAEPLPVFLEKPVEMGLPGDPLNMGPIFPVSGILLEWYRSNFLQKQSDAAVINGKNIYAELDCEAAKVPIGCEKLILLPHMYGERNPTHDPYAKGVLYGLSINHTSIHIYRAIMESYCYSVRHALTAMEKNNEIVHLDNIFVSGGGAKSKLWRQMTSDILKCDTYFYQKADETRAGAYLAAMGAGYFDNVDIFYKNWLGECKYTSTNIDDSIKYDKVYKIYENIYERLKGSYKSLSNI